MILQLLETKGLSPALSGDESLFATRFLTEAAGLDIYPRSVTVADGSIFFLVRNDGEKYLAVVSKVERPEFEGRARTIGFDGTQLVMQVCPRTPANTEALRKVVPFLRPQVLGLRKSAGCGDRLGLATPGHLHSIRKHTLAPILAQQSIREMTRTERTPQEVMDDACWGVFQEGWREGFGADADHLKTFEDIDRCLASGFTFYTIDPSAYVDNDADADVHDTLAQKYEKLPWDVLDTTPEKLRTTFTSVPFEVGTFSFAFDEDTFLRAAVKYGAAVAHTVRMFRYLEQQAGNRPFELEMSVDETETPTTVQEHFFVASELKRLGVRWVSLAPRFVGRMEKGVDYIGDVEAFERDLIRHVAIAKQVGPYKLSLHSGSDKFTIYPLFAKHAGELFHLKTAGTSYLEALRAIATIDPKLFREIYAFSYGRYDTDKATYHVSAELAKAPAPDQVTDAALPDLLNQFDARQILHVTFGSVLTVRDESGKPRFRDRVKNALKADENLHYRALEKHFDRHLGPFGAR